MNYSEKNNYYTENAELRDYFVTLEPVVQQKIIRSETEIATLGELKICSENIRKQIYGDK